MYQNYIKRPSNKMSNFIRVNLKIYMKNRSQDKKEAKKDEPKPVTIDTILNAVAQNEKVQAEKDKLKAAEEAKKKQREAEKKAKEEAKAAKEIALRVQDRIH